MATSSARLSVATYGGLSSLRHVLSRSSSLRLGVIILVALIAASVLGAIFLSDPNEQDLSQVYQEPSFTRHLMGTDPLGRDVLAWTAAGIQTALLVSVSVAFLSALLGATVGLVAGYFGGLIDAVLMRIVDLWLAVPPLLLVLAASAVITTNNIGILILLLTIVVWVPYARLVRARVMTDRYRGYIAAARLAGASRSRVIAVHLLPSASTIVLVVMSLQIGWVLLAEAALSFLGFGVLPPHVSLGFMIAQGRDTLQDSWWIVTFPGLAIVLLVLAANLIADGLRDLFHLDLAASRG